MSAIRLLVSSDVDDVVEAVARDQHRASELNHFIDATLDREELSDSYRRRQTPTWIALDGTRLVGHLTATTLQRPSGRVSAWISPDAASFDDVVTLGALYAFAGARWLADGVEDHEVWTYDRPDTRDPWLELGFAQRFRRGCLELVSRGEPNWPPGYRLRHGTRDDLDVALHFNDLLDHEDAAGPSFARPEPFDRDGLDETLDDPDTVHAVVEHRGVPVAQAIVFPLLPVRGAHERTVHLSAVVVEPAHRGRGVATAMLDELADEPRRRGFQYADVTWRTANLAAAAFWRAYGVTATYVRLQRRLGDDAT